MAESDYYNSGDSSEPADKTESSKDESGEDMAETFLAPSSAFGPDCEVGDKKTVVVVSKHEKELELKYVKKEDKEEKSASKPDEAHASIDAGIAKMGMM